VNFFGIDKIGFSVLSNESCTSGASIGSRTFFDSLAIQLAGIFIAADQKMFSLK